MDAYPVRGFCTNFARRINERNLARSYRIPLAHSPDEKISILKLDHLLKTLSDYPATAVRLMMPDQTFVPDHFHITEVGRVQKDFVDCGGTIRSQTACVLQVWLANDTDHRLNSDKLLQIMRLAAPVLMSSELPVELEYEEQTLSQYQLTEVDTSTSEIVLRLVSKHSGCLAPDRCGVKFEFVSDCEGPNCC